MKTFIKVEIDDNTFIELPIECVEKWMQNDEIQKQFQFIKDNTLACFVYDIPCELSFEEVKELGRRELIQWALYDACLKVNDELADI